MTEPDAQPVDEAVDSPAVEDPSASALGGLIDEGVPRADSHDPTPDEPVPPAVA